MREELASQIAKELVLALIEKNAFSFHLRTEIKDHLRNESEIEAYNKKAINQLALIYQEAYSQILKTID